MKFKALLTAFSVAAVAAGALAQSAPPAPEFSPADFRAHVVYLADDRLEGREAGKSGHEVAARYVASQFEALGLRPANAGSWFQPVQLVNYETVGMPRLSLGGRTFNHGGDFVMRANPDAAPLALEAPLVFAGYGFDLPARGFDDYRGLDVRGKVVVVFSGRPASMPSDVGAHLDYDKARMAAERGAVGLLVIRTNADNATLPYSRFARSYGRSRTTWIDRDGRPFEVGALRFTATVDRPLARLFFADAPRSFEQVLATVSRPGGRPEGFALRRNVRLERQGARLTRFTSPNVVALLPGSDPSVADEYVLLMAHLDGLGVRLPEAGDRPDEDRIRNGAMDNASGVATLIEVAKAMSHSGQRPRRPILFAAVTAEEVGLLGAAYLAYNPVDQSRVVSVVNLDMPILTYDFQDVTAFGAEHSTMGPIVARAAARMGVRVSPDPLPQEGLFARSDHYPFVRRGVPSVFLMTGFAGEGRQRFTSFLQNNYHSTRDDLNQFFDWNAGARFARLNYLIAREIANEAEAPMWYAGSFFGDTVGRGQRLAQGPPSGGAESSQGQAAPH